MKRRNFIKAASALGLATAIPTLNALASDIDQKDKKNAKVKELTGADDREYWANLLYRISEPVLSNLSKGELRKNMTLELSPIFDNRVKDLGYLEAFARLFTGIGPWISLPDDSTAEGKQRKQLREWTMQSIVHSVDPKSPDYMTWNTANENQPLVEAAYMAQAFLHNTKELWEPLDNTTKQRFISELKGLRRIKPAYNNWVLFYAMTEAFLISIDEGGDPYRVDIGIRKINEWYSGDGWYADGPKFAMDYYNGYVIHSMLLDVVDVFVNKSKMVPKNTYDLALKRMQRFSEFLERFISPEGTYPAFGRSVTYRVGAFQPLVHLALIEKLPQGISNAQVRCALTAVLKNMFSIEGNFDKNNFLQLGFAGHQPNLADYYTNSGSLYITSLGFLPLGLPANHDFWTAPPADWTSKKAWSGQQFKKDYAVNY